MRSRVSAAWARSVQQPAINAAIIKLSVSAVMRLMISTQVNSFRFISHVSTAVDVQEPDYNPAVQARLRYPPRRPVRYDDE